MCPERLGSSWQVMNIIRIGSDSNDIHNLHVSDSTITPDFPLLDFTLPMVILKWSVLG